MAGSRSRLPLCARGKHLSEPFAGLRLGFLTPNSAGGPMRANLGLNRAANLKTGEPTPASEKGLRAGPACDEPNPELEALRKQREGEVAQPILAR